MNSWLTIVLRVLHIGGGVFWAGGMFVVAGYVEPAATAAGCPTAPASSCSALPAAALPS